MTENLPKTKTNTFNNSTGLLQGLQDLSSEPFTQMFRSACNDKEGDGASWNSLSPLGHPHPQELQIILLSLLWA